MRARHLSRLGLGAWLLVLGGCGPVLENIGIGESESKPAEEEKTETVPVEVRVSEKGAALALLADATAFSMVLDGCASGYSQSLDETDIADAKVYKFDQNCLARLTSFTVNGIVYTPKAGSEFVNYQANETAIFEDASAPANIIRVSIVSQLSSPISADTAEAVEYRFAEIAEGGGENISSSVVGASSTLKVAGQAAPEFDIKSVEYAGMTADGAGQFVFGMECMAALTGSGASSACKDAALADVSYKLVQDTYGGVLTLVDADAIFASAGSSIDLGVELVAAGDVAMPNGGFNTKGAADAAVLTGPDQMHNNPQMLLVLKVGASYQYFQVDVTTLTQP